MPCLFSRKWTLINLYFVSGSSCSQFFNCQKTYKFSARAAVDKLPYSTACKRWIFLKLATASLHHKLILTTLSHYFNVKSVLVITFNGNKIDKLLVKQNKNLYRKMIRKYNYNYRTVMFMKGTLNWDVRGLLAMHPRLLLSDKSCIRLE